MTDEKDYKTDRFGHPNDRDHHYRIPLNDDSAMRKATWALNSMLMYKDRFVTKWDKYSGDKLSYMGIQTHDSKGHLTGLAEYAHSPKWENLGVMSDIDEYRGGVKGGGTKVKGTFNVDPMSFNGVSTLQFETVLDVTPTELEAAYEDRGETWDKIQDTIHWAKRDAMDSAREQIAEKQRQCEHNHVVGNDPDSSLPATCEDCGADVRKDENDEWVLYH
jgi:hypothetical protein